MARVASVIPFDLPRSVERVDERFVVDDAWIWQLAALIPLAITTRPGCHRHSESQPAAAVSTEGLHRLLASLRSQPNLAEYLAPTIGDWEALRDADRWYFQFLSELQKLLDQGAIVSTSDADSTAPGASRANAVGADDVRPNELDAIRCLRIAIRRGLHDLQHELHWREDVERTASRMVYDFAYGLTHEINNPLANIAARAQQLIARAADKDKTSLSIIVDQSMRAHEMLAEMMLAVQPPQLQMAWVDVRTVVLEALESLESIVVQSQIALDLQVSEHTLMARCDASALREVLQALVRNSIEACRAGDKIELIAELVPVPDEIDKPLDRKSRWNFATQSVSNNGQIPRQQRLGRWEVRLAVLDNGPGIATESLDRVWDLYYSGREAGRGLGIGLCKVRRIVESHAGRVWLNSSPNAGVSVEIRLPIDRDGTLCV